MKFLTAFSLLLSLTLTSCVKERDQLIPYSNEVSDIIKGLPEFNTSNNIIFISNTIVSSYGDQINKINSSNVFINMDSSSKSRRIVEVKEYLQKNENGLSGNLNNGRQEKNIVITDKPTGRITSVSFSTPQGLIPVNVTDFPLSIIDKKSNLPLRWVSDPNNEFHEVQIQLTYMSGLSRLDNPSLPTTMNSLVYTVPDNGHFNIPVNAMSDFPIDSYYILTIARASTGNTGDISLLGVDIASSVPLKIIYQMPTLLSNFTVATSNSDPCNFTAIASAVGGIPPYSYEWFRYSDEAPNFLSLGFDSFVTGTGNCLPIGSANQRPTPPLNNTILRLQVTDSRGNKAFIAKRLSHAIVATEY